MNLAEMSLVQLARARQSGSPDVLAERDAIDAELERRQRMLAAAEGMRLALSAYVEGIPQEDAANYSAYRNRRRNGYEALNAYAAAKVPTAADLDTIKTPKEWLEEPTP